MAKTQNKGFSIYKSGDGYCGQIELGKDENGKRKTKRFKGKTYAEVAKKIAQFQLQMESGAIQTKGTLLKDFMFSYLVNYKKNSIKPTSYCRTYTTYSKHICPYIGNATLEELNIDDIQMKLINALIADGYSYSTVHKAYVLLNETLRNAVRKGIISTNKCELLTVPQKKSFSHKDIRYLNDDEIKRFTETALLTNSDGSPKYLNGLYVISMMYTGLRVGEAAALKWKDIDFEKGIINVHANIVTTYVDTNSDGTPNKRSRIEQSGTKTRSFRYVNMTKSAKQYLSMLYEREHPKPTDYVTLTDNEVSPEVLANTYKYICNRADITDSQGIHTLRHTCASLLIRNGVD